MINIVLGGNIGDPEFENWLNLNCKYVRRFVAMTPGELARFSVAVNESCNIIIKRDHHGEDIKRVPANDPMLVHVPYDSLSNVNMDRLKSFLILAKDAGLQVMSCSYSSALGDDLAKKLW